MKVDSCPPCWAAKHECERARPTGCCRSCKAHMRSGVNDSQASIKYAQPLYNAAAYEQLYTRAPPRSLPSLDTHGADSNTLNLHVTTSAGSTTTLLLQIIGPFTPQNQTVVEHVDRFVSQNFSARLEAKGDSRLIANAALTGGYLYLLCSNMGVAEHIETSRDGLHVQNEYSGYNLQAHLNYFLVCRLRELINDVLEAIRFEDPLNSDSYLCSNAYAAAVILRCEIEHFRCSLRNGPLQNCVPQGLKALLLDWFTSVERELMERIREGCSRFPVWRSPIKGSMKKFRRRGETFTIKMRLHLRNFTLDSLQDGWIDISPFATLGQEDCMLVGPSISRPTSAFEFPIQPFILMDLNRTSTSEPPPTFEPILELQPPGLPEGYYPFSTALPAPEFEQSLQRESFEFEPGIGQAGLTATLDPRYLSTTDWYSSHNNV